MPTRLLALLCLLLPFRANGFTLSQAPVTPDPGAGGQDYAELWPHIGLQEARRLHGSEGVVFVDGRSYREWQRSHIPGALALPAGEFDKRYPLLRAALVHAKVVVCYCHGKSCGVADYVAQRLADRGHRNLAVYSGGYPEWKEAGLPLEGAASAKKTKPLKKPK